MPPRRVIGIDAGGTKLLGGVVDEELLVHHRVRRTWRGADRRETVEIIVEVVEELRAVAPETEAIGLGLPALVDQRTGEAVWSNHLPIDGVAFGSLLSERVGLPVAVDNDSNAAMLAEHRHGAARGAADAILLALGTGIGGGLVLGGRLHRGAHGFGAELGHMVVDLHGPDCPGDCPGRGCLEVHGAGTAIGVAGRHAAAADPESTLGRRARAAELTGPMVTELAHAGDAQARSVLASVGQALGVGLASLANALDPELIVIGGGAGAAGELLLEPAREVVSQRALPPIAERVRIVPARFGPESAMLGGALMAIDLEPA